MKIKAQYETETYISEGGYLCIRQEFDGDERLVILSPYQCKLLAAELLKAAKNSDWWSEVISE